MNLLLSSSEQNPSSFTPMEIDIAERLLINELSNINNNSTATLSIQTTVESSLIPPFSLFILIFLVYYVWTRCSPNSTTYRKRERERLKAIYQKEFFEKYGHFDDLVSPRAPTFYEEMRERWRLIVNFLCCITYEEHKDEENQLLNQGKAARGTRSSDHSPHRGAESNRSSSNWPKSHSDDASGSNSDTDSALRGEESGPATPLIMSPRAQTMSPSSKLPSFDVFSGPLSGRIEPSSKGPISIRPFSFFAASSKHESPSPSSRASAPERTIPRINIPTGAGVGSLHERVSRSARGMQSARGGQVFHQPMIPLSLNQRRYTIDRASEQGILPDLVLHHLHDSSKDLLSGIAMNRLHTQHPPGDTRHKLLTHTSSSHSSVSLPAPPHPSHVSFALSKYSTDSSLAQRPPSVDATPKADGDNYRLSLNSQVTNATGNTSPTNSRHISAASVFKRFKDSFLGDGETKQTGPDDTTAASTNSPSPIRQSGQIRATQSKDSTTSSPPRREGVKSMRYGASTVSAAQEAEHNETKLNDSNTIQHQPTVPDFHAHKKTASPARRKSLNALSTLDVMSSFENTLKQSVRAVRRASLNERNSTTTTAAAGRRMSTDVNPLRHTYRHSSMSGAHHLHNPNNYSPPSSPHRSTRPLSATFTDLFTLTKSPTISNGNEALEVDRNSLDHLSHQPQVPTGTNKLRQSLKRRVQVDNIVASLFEPEQTPPHHSTESHHLNPLSFLRRSSAAEDKKPLPPPLSPVSTSYKAIYPNVPGVSPETEYTSDVNPDPRISAHMKPLGVEHT